MAAGPVLPGSAAPSSVPCVPLNGLITRDTLTRTRRPMTWRPPPRGRGMHVPDVPDPVAELVKRRHDPVVVQTVRSTAAATIAYVVALELSKEPAPLTAPLTALLVVQVTLYATLTRSLRRVEGRDRGRPDRRRLQRAGRADLVESVPDHPRRPDRGLSRAGGRLGPGGGDQRHAGPRRDAGDHLRLGPGAGDPHRGRCRDGLQLLLRPSGVGARRPATRSRTWPAGCAS